MKGFVLKATIVIVALFSSFAFATTTSNISDFAKSNRQNNSAGCMACHQGEETLSTENVSKNDSNQHSQKKVLTASK